MDVIDWIEHGNLIHRSLLRAVEKDKKEKRNALPYDDDDLHELRREMNLRDFCWNNRDKSDDFNGSAAVWWWYMTEHAGLQIKRYSNTITEREFHQRCRVLREQRRKTEPKYITYPWTKQRRKVS